jgi:hypothetical protein
VKWSVLEFHAEQAVAWDEYREAMRIQDKSLIRITPLREGPIATGGFPADVAARLGD